MTTEIQAPEGGHTAVMRQALEALENSSPHNNGAGWIKKHHAAKRALQDALAAQPATVKQDLTVAAPADGGLDVYAEQAMQAYRDAIGPAKHFRPEAEVMLTPYVKLAIEGAISSALAAQPQARVALTDAQLEHEWRHFNAPVDNPISLSDFECVAIVVQEALGIRASQTKEQP